MDTLSSKLEDFLSTIGKRLKEERERLGYNQTDFGTIGGVKKRAQIWYESDKRRPDADYMAAIATVGADTKYIIEGVRTDTYSTLSEEERGILEKILRKILRIF